MAYTTLVNFFDKLKIADFSMYPDASLITSQTGGGDILTAENGPRLWKGRITLAPMSHANARIQSNLVNTMMNAGAKFEVIDKKNQYPLEDPKGTLTQGYVPKVSGSTSGSTFVLTAARPGYVLNPGDRFAYRINGKRYYNEVTNRQIATINGGFVALPVMCPIRGPGTPLNNATVIFQRPSIVAQIIPGSVSQFVFNPSHAEGMSFDFIQVIKE
ncbi:hypothetical protein [Paracoccus sulfuroxidans]|uniref:Uncharacterized protein n=1 Tax=Paracoccus sulfuroxidans TaxID=384678 RepID=A0A562P2L1_9RHOB|nr:hypothetical protein [Paracoccus sulfuroxidans]TWI38226.1 hypothetical protein IQ24_00364 [Paracoccus sulfuroxidans]